MHREPIRSNIEAGGSAHLGHDHRGEEDEGGPVRLRRHQGQVRPVPHRAHEGEAVEADRGERRGGGGVEQDDHGVNRARSRRANRRAAAHRDALRHIGQKDL